MKQKANFISLYYKLKLIRKQADQLREYLFNKSYERPILDS